MVEKNEDSNESETDNPITKSVNEEDEKDKNEHDKSKDANENENMTENCLLMWMFCFLCSFFLVAEF